MIDKCECIFFTDGECNIVKKECEPIEFCSKGVEVKEFLDYLKCDRNNILWSPNADKVVEWLTLRGLYDDDSSFCKNIEKEEKTNLLGSILKSLNLYGKKKKDNPSD